MFPFRNPWMKPPILGELRWSGWRSRTWSCPSSCSGPWLQRPRPAERPEPRSGAGHDTNRWLHTHNWLKKDSRSGCLCAFVFQIIAAEGEMKASRALKEASLVIAESPSALQLRYLQSLNSIAAEKNSTIIFPLPIDMLQCFMQHKWQRPLSSNTVVTNLEFRKVKNNSKRKLEG